VGRRRAYYVSTATIHISEAEATRDFAALLTRVRGETEIVIENGTDAVAVIHTAAPVRRSVSECIRLAKQHEGEAAGVPVLDPDCAADVEKIVAARRGWKPPPWD